MADEPVVLMLTIDEPTTEDLWRAWLPPSRRILVNSKKWKPEVGDATFQLLDDRPPLGVKDTMTWNVVETSHSDASLVRAHEHLLRKALQLYPDACHYVLVSGDTAPIQKYAKFSAHMKLNAGVTLLNKFLLRGATPILEMLKLYAEGSFWNAVKTAGKDVLPVSQWSAVSNAAAKILIKKNMTQVAKDYQAIMKHLGMEKNVAPDETVVPAMLQYYAGKKTLLDDDASPMYVFMDLFSKYESEAVAEKYQGLPGQDYQNALSELSYQSDTKFFARKIKSLSEYERRNTVVERGVLEDPLKPLPAALNVVQLTPRPKDTTTRPLAKRSSGGAAASRTKRQNIKP